MPPFSTIQSTTTVTDGFTKKLGTHLIQFGFYDVFALYNNLTTGNDNGTVEDTVAAYGTNSNYQYDNNSTGNEFADLLVGDISGYTQSSQNVMAHMENRRFDFYGEDTWKANSRRHHQLRRAPRPHRVVVRSQRPDLGLQSFGL